MNPTLITRLRAAIGRERHAVLLEAMRLAGRAAADPATVGFVPPVTYEQAASWLGSVDGWVSLARQARANPDYDLGRELALPARLPSWAEAQEHPPNTWPPCAPRSRRYVSTRRWRCSP